MFQVRLYTQNVGRFLITAQFKNNLRRNMWLTQSTKCFEMCATCAVDFSSTIQNNSSSMPHWKLNNRMHELGVFQHCDFI